MPKIAAATVAEHRAQQERALLDAAHAVLEATGQAPTMAEVADRAGLARSSVYQYFGSRKDLLHALVRDVFPRWTERVTDAMDAAEGLVERVVAYAQENVRLVAEGAHAIGSALATLTPGGELDEQAREMHRRLQEPLIAVLAELGAEDPEAMGELVNAMVHSSTLMLEGGRSLDVVLANLRAAVEPLARSLG